MQTKNTLKKLASLFVAFTLLIGSFAFTASAQESPTALYGAASGAGVVTVSPIDPSVRTYEYAAHGLTIQTYGNFETAGINVRWQDTADRLYLIEFDTNVPAGAPHPQELVFRRTVTADLLYREAGATDWFQGHRFSIYDQLGIATSMFNLSLDTAYEVRVLIWEDFDDGYGPQLIFDNIESLATLHTKPEFTVPDWTVGEGWTIINVSTIEQLRQAVNNASAGHVILLDCGIDLNANATAAAFSMTGRTGTHERPIILTSAGEMATIRGTSTFHNSNHVLVHNLRFTNRNTPNQENLAFLVRISGTSTHITMSGNYIHDQGPGNYRGAIDVIGAHGVRATHHLFINNNLSNDHHIFAGDRWNVSDPERGYYGIMMRDNPNLGGFYTIRNNTFTGFVDAIHSSGYYRNPRLWSPIAGGMAHDDFNSVFYIQEIDIYDNIIYEVNDDAIEADGQAVNARFFRNIIGDTYVGFSFAYLYPGPTFFLENVITAVRRNSLKTNTGVGNYVHQGRMSGATMNLFLYNNTIIHYEGGVQTGTGSAVWEDLVGHVCSMSVVNNIFVSRGRSREAGGHGTWWHSYNYEMIDGNLYFSRGGEQFFRFFTSREFNAGFVSYSTFATYQTSMNARWPGFEQNSRFAANQAELGIILDVPHPDFPVVPWVTYPRRVVMHDVSLQPSSFAIDSGVYIPGISRSTTPNVGASHAFNTGVARQPVVDPISMQVIYNANGGVGAVPVDPTAYTMGQTIDVMGAGSLTRPGFEFRGWSLDPQERDWDSGITTIVVTTVPARVTLYAMWQPTVSLSSVRIRGVEAYDVGVPARQPVQAIRGQLVLERAEANNLQWNSGANGIAWTICPTSLPGTSVGRGVVIPHEGEIPTAQQINNMANTATPVVWYAGRNKTLQTGDTIIITLIPPGGDQGDRMFQVLTVEILGETLPDRGVVYRDALGGIFRTEYFNPGDTVYVNFTQIPTRDHFALAGWSRTQDSATATYYLGGAESFVMGDYTDPVELWPVWQPTSVYIDWLSINGVYANLGVPHAQATQAIPGVIRLTPEQATDVRFFVNHLTGGPDGFGDAGGYFAGPTFDPSVNVAEVQFDIVGHRGMFKPVAFPSTATLTDTNITSLATWTGAFGGTNDVSAPHTFGHGDFLGLRVNWYQNTDVHRLYYVIFIEIVTEAEVYELTWLRVADQLAALAAGLTNSSADINQELELGAISLTTEQATDLALDDITHATNPTDGAIDGVFVFPAGANVTPAMVDAATPVTWPTNLADGEILVVRLAPQANGSYNAFYAFEITIDDAVPTLISAVRFFGTVYADMTGATEGDMINSPTTPVVPGTVRLTPEQAASIGVYNILPILTAGGGNSWDMRRMIFPPDNPAGVTPTFLQNTTGGGGVLWHTGGGGPARAVEHGYIIGLRVQTVTPQTTIAIRVLIVCPTCDEYIPDCVCALVASVSINQNDHGIIEGDTSQLSVTITPTSAVNQNVVWTSSDITVATVSPGGLVAAISVGTATITVTTECGSHTDSIVITVTAGAVLVEAVLIDQNNHAIVEGETSQLTFAILPTSATNQSVVWVSSDGLVATVNADGLVTAVAPGTVTITVTTECGNHTDSIEITVTAQPILCPDCNNPVDDCTCPIIVVVNRTALQALVTQAGTRSQNNYTAATWTAFAGQLTNAQAVLANNDATQEQVDAAYATLRAALNALQRRPQDPPVNGGNGGNGTSGGGGGGTPTPRPPVQQPNQAITIPAAYNQVTVQVRQLRNREATLHLPTPVINEIINASEYVIEFDLRELDDVATVTFPGNSWNSFAQTELGIEINMPDGTLYFDADAVQSINDLARTANLSVTMYEVEPDNLTPAQLDALPADGKVINIKVSSGNHVIDEFEGTLTVSVYYDGAYPLAVWQLDEAGNLELVEFGFDPETGIVTFTTASLGQFVIGYHAYEETAPPTDVTEPEITNTLIFTTGNIVYLRNQQAMQNAVAAPFIDPETDRMMVPLRTLAEALGIAVDWYDDTRSALIFLPDGTIVLPVDEQLPDGMGMPMIVNDRTFIPLRFVMYAFGATVEWDGENYAAIIIW